MVMLTIILMGVGSYVMRAIFILALSDKTFPPMALRALEYVAPAVMASLVMTMLVAPAEGSLPASVEGEGGVQLARQFPAASLTVASL